MPIKMGNSESKANDQGLLAGQISSYCLVCEMPLKNPETSAHFLTFEHKENLDKYSVMEDFKQDGIRKVPKGYYCKYCNLYLRSLSKVNIHVTSSIHTDLKSGNTSAIQNQACTQLVPKDDHVQAFDCVKIELDVWNGVLNNTCLVCDVDVENVRAHCELPEHGINLIQAHVLEKNFHLYRKLDEISVQCLTCNAIILAKDLPKHFDSKTHEIKLKNASNGRITKRDVSNFDLNQKFVINEYFDINGDGDAGSGLCLMCYSDIETDKISAHTHGYHHQRMVELHKAWIEQNKWKKLDVERNAEVIPLYGVFYDDLDVNTAENNNVFNEHDKNKMKKSVYWELGVHIGKLHSESIQNFVSEKDGVSNCGNVKSILTADSNSGNVGSNSGNVDSKSGNVDFNSENVDFNSENVDSNSGYVDCNNGNVDSNKENSKTVKNEAVNLTDKENILPNINMSQPSTSKSNEIIAKPKEQSIEDFAQEYAIKYKVKGITTCQICNERVRGTIEDMKTHIQSSKHKKKFFKTTKISRTNYETKRMQDYHNFSFNVNLVMSNHVIVNGALCVDIFSYHCFVPEGDKLKCVLCNKVLDDKKRAQHHNTELHKRLWGNCLVITSFEKELIREVKSGLYHCGFCNVTFTVWDQLLEHLMSRRHKMHRLSSDKIYKCHFSNDFAQNLSVFLGLMRAMNA